MNARRARSGACLGLLAALALAGCAQPATAPDDLTVMGPGVTQGPCPGAASAAEDLCVTLGLLLPAATDGDRRRAEDQAEAIEAFWSQQPVAGLVVRVIRVAAGDPSPAAQSVVAASAPQVAAFAGLTGPERPAVVQAVVDAGAVAAQVEPGPLALGTPNLLHMGATACVNGLNGLDAIQAGGEPISSIGLVGGDDPLHVGAVRWATSHGAVASPARAPTAVPAPAAEPGTPVDPAAAQEGAATGATDPAQVVGDPPGDPAGDQGQPAGDQGQPAGDQGQPAGDQGQPAGDQAQPSPAPTPAGPEGEESDTADSATDATPTGAPAEVGQAGGHDVLVVSPADEALQAARALVLAGHTGPVLIDADRVDESVVTDALGDVVLEGRLVTVSALPPPGSDTPGHDALDVAVRQAQGPGQLTPAHVRAWAVSEALAAVLRRAVARQDLSRTGLLAVLSRIVDVDTGGMTAFDAGNLAGTPNAGASRSTVTSAASGLSVGSPFYEGPTIGDVDLVSACGPTSPGTR